MDNSKDLFFKAINLRKVSRCPVGLHWWGIYKYGVLGLDYKKDAWKEGEELSKVYSKFYEKFKPDWFHLHIGTPIYFKNSEIIKRDNKSYLMIDPRYRDIKKEDKYFSVNSSDDEEIVDFPDYLLGSRSNKPKVDLSSKSKIDDYIKKYIHMDSEEIIELGYTDHVLKIVEKYRDDVFTAVHIPSAICEIFDPTTGYLGFERGLIAFHDYPVTMRYLLERCYEEQLEWAKAYAIAGVHAYIISESYISPDLANPNIYRNFMKDIHKDYFKEVENMGPVPICMFFGDVNQILEDLTEINIKALMVEESKKGFDLDIKKIRDQIGNRVCVFGNVDSISLLHNGTPKEVKDEVIAQARGAKNNFIIANGSPITPGTPEANIKSFISAAKEEQWN